MRPETVLSLTVAILLPACGQNFWSAHSHHTRVISPQPPPPVPDTSAHPAAAGQPTQTVVIEDVQIFQNGQAGNVDPGFIQRFALEMRRSGLFRVVYDPANAHLAPADAVRLQLRLSETLDRHWAEKVGKDILVGMSYLTLMPVMPYQMDYDVSLQVTATLPDESVVEIESSTKAEVDYKSFSDSRAAEEDLKRTALNDCLNGLLTKMKTNPQLRSAVELVPARP